MRTGVPLLVDNPREVGADRVVNTLAAHQLCGTACVVVDFGTSTNIDVVSERGEFLGGALAPGIEISMEALAARAAALRTVELVAPRSVIGKNTVECLQSGVLYGFAGQVDGLVRRILAELGAGPVTVLGTGGLAPLMAEESETITTYVPDLTLLGPAADLPAQPRTVRPGPTCRTRALHGDRSLTWVREHRAARQPRPRTGGLRSPGADPGPPGEAGRHARRRPRSLPRRRAADAHAARGPRRPSRTCRRTPPRATGSASPAG